MASLDPSRRAELGALLQRLTSQGARAGHYARRTVAEEFATRILTIEVAL